MDLEAVLQHAALLEHQAANEVFTVLTTVSGIVPSLMAVWHGDDANRFEQEWEMHRKDLSLLHGSLTGLVASLQRSVADQRHASDV
jgi:hypothetical protein